MILNNCKFYLLPHQKILLNWKQSYSSFSEKLDLSRLENSMKFGLLRFHLLWKCKASVKMSLTQNTISENFSILNYIEFRVGKVKFLRIIAVTLLPID